MSVVTNTATVKTTSAIWEFDPTLPGNCVLSDSLDIISALRTLTIKIQASCNGRIFYLILSYQAHVSYLITALVLSLSLSMAVA